LIQTRKHYLICLEKYLGGTCNFFECESNIKPGDAIHKPGGWASKVVEAMSIGLIYPHSGNFRVDGASPSRNGSDLMR